MEQQRELLRVSQGSWHLANHRGTATGLREMMNKRVWDKGGMGCGQRDDVWTQVLSPHRIFPERVRMLEMNIFLYSPGKRSLVDTVALSVHTG